MPDPLHVLHFAPGPYMGRYFTHLSRFSEAAGLHFSFVAMGSCSGAIDRDIRAQHSSLETVRAFSYRSLPLVISQLARILRRASPDLLHSHGFYAGLAASAAARLACIPLIIGRHHADSMHLDGTHLHVMLDRFQNNSAVSVVACSEFVRQWIITNERADPARCATVHYGLPPESFEKPAQPTIEALSREFDLDGASVVLLPGRLVPAKGQRTLIDAVPFISTDGGRDLRVLLLGDGPDRSVLDRMIRSRGLDHTVRLVGFRNDLRPFYHLADVTVLPTTTDAFPQVVLESLAQGTCVIANRVGGIPEALPQDAGTLLDERGPHALGTALSTVLGDPDRRRAMGVAGREHTIRSFTCAAMLSGLADVYRSSLAPRP